MVFDQVLKDWLRSNILVNGIFNLGNKKLVKVKCIAVYGIFDLGDKKLLNNRTILIFMSARKMSTSY